MDNNAKHRPVGGGAKKKQIAGKTKKMSSNRRQSKANKALMMPLSPVSEVGALYMEGTEEPPNKGVPAGGQWRLGHPLNPVSFRP